MVLVVALAFFSVRLAERRTETSSPYPTDTLITAPDIIFFWVARMIMAGLEFRGEVPFQACLFHQHYQGYARAKDEQIARQFSGPA